MLDTICTDSVKEALDLADAQHWTRQPPRSDRARLRFLLRHQDIRALAARLRCGQARLTEVLAGASLVPDDPLRRRIYWEVIRLWQPRVRRRVHDAVSAGKGNGMVVCFRARFGFAAAVGSSDDPRLRLLTLRLANEHAALLFEARHRDADEQEFLHILADAAGASYFNIVPSSRLREVSLTEIEFVEFSY